MLEDEHDAAAEAGRGRGVTRRSGFTLQRPIVLAESVLYLVIGALLLLAAGLALGDTVVNLFRGSTHRDVSDIGLFVLERTLLLFMIAELLATLRITDFGARILLQPFLLIAMIAVIRRILVATAEFEGGGGRRQLEDFLLELGGLAGLVLALAVALWLMRAARE
jgi:phosphate starvation-inducible membrane PsiE